MEIEGLKRGLKSLTEEGLQVKSLTTDRHTETIAYMEEERPNISHTFDVWHFIKSEAIIFSKHGPEAMMAIAFTRHPFVRPSVSSAILEVFKTIIVTGLKLYEHI